MTVLVVASIALALVTVPIAMYLGALALLARPPKAKSTGEATAPRRRFAVVVPAHDEEANIAQTVRSLLAVEYPSGLRRVVVVADNCTDRTAREASFAGAEVIERTDAERRGKGYALELAFDTILKNAKDDAIVVVDADTCVSTNLLTAFDRCLSEGAGAVQAEYGVSNAEDSWRTRLMVIALAMFHRLRMLARERLGLSVGLRGNGMCFSCELLRAHPHTAYGLVEDVEYGVALGLAGHRVHYAHEALVSGEMPATGSAAKSQRARWEGGRLQLLATHLPSLLRAAIRRRSLVVLDLAADLLVPPLSFVALAVGAGMAIEVAASVFVGIDPYRALAWSIAAVSLFAYVARGVQLAGWGWGGWLVLARAPAYVLWKLLLVRPWSGTRGWVRTRRKSEGPVQVSRPSEAPR